MYLKRLELAGFKTFADRTDLEFAPGITAIVGPNGSGKSNLSDAVRWALGEQRAHALRGARTEDFIFAGSARRRAHGLAQVGLILDNTNGALPLEFSEIGVMRRATRGGDGEFFLNGVPCRLRDIQLLFLGTGLGGRSYALIGQGEVEAVLNASPQERRLLLEEAAGLARYKRRRGESLRKLEHAEAHLQRIRDLLGELQVQHAHLTEQAEAARQQRAYLQEMRTLEQALTADEARRVRSSAERSASQTDLARARLGELAEAAEAARREAESHHRHSEELTRGWEAHQRRLLEVVRAQAAAETAVDRAEGRLAAHRQEEARLAAEAASLEEDLERLGAEMTGVVSERQLADDEAVAMQRELADLLAALEEDERRTVALTAEVNAQEARRADLLTGRQDLARHVAAAEARATLLERQQRALAERRRRLEERLGDVTAEEARLARRLREIQEAADRSGASHAAAVQRVRALEEEREALDDEERAAEGRRHRLEARLQALEEATAQFAGYEEGARSLLLARRGSPGRLAGILGALVDHIEVAPPYRAAVEAALGRRLFCLLTQGTGDVREALTALRADGGGPVSFLPLDRLAGRHDTGTVPEGDGILGPATDFVRAKGDAERAVEALLRDVVVVADLDRALALIASRHRGRVVTVAGELLSPDGVVTVRAARNGEGSPLSRRGDIETARRDLEEVASALGRHGERRLELDREIQAAGDEIARLDEERSAHERAAAQAQAALAAAARERARFPLDLEEIAADARETAAALADLEAARAQSAAEAETLEAAARESDEAIAAAQRARQTHLAALEALRRQANGARLRQAGLDATRRGLTAREGDFGVRRGVVVERRDRILAGASALAGERPRLEADAAGVREAHQRLTQEQAEVQEGLAGLEADRAARDAAHASTVEQARRAEEEARAGEAALHRAEVRAAQAEAEWTALERRLAEAGLDWSAAEQIPLSLPRDEARGRLEALRGLLAAMGPVNMRAIDEQEALASRLDRLTDQVEDLDGARAALAELVARLDAVLRVRFRETFEAVSAEFGRLFHRLFEGGSGHLELVAETPEAEPGLEVIARLPGKPPRSLAALSGGERVLVALSLLFAMLRVHPSPFCVFDEVEAALDDANTARFATLLRELAEISQIIIITHNKGTMEAADVLYGITMQEPGVSSVLSVRLGARAPRADPFARPAEVVPSAR
ncbi:MAG: chromosome segregation protein SMC [Armatimonadetes bacterium]|nr:chromosome segregation protein SMC [Armatimonadota bacterium]